MTPPDPTLENDERLLAEAVAAADRLHDKPRCWMARYGDFSVQGKTLIAGLAEYRKIRSMMSEKLKAKAVKPESAKW